MLKCAGTEREEFKYKIESWMYPLIISINACYVTQLQWYDIFLMSVCSDRMDVFWQSCSHLLC